jgi:hypothetical protein
MAVDISGISYFAPIAAFLLVFIVSFAIFHKTKILGESKFIQIFISFIIAVLFVSAAGVRVYTQVIIPWVAVLLISLVFIMAITTFIGKDMEFLHKGIGIGAVILLAIIFLVSAFFVFSHVITSYLPGQNFGSGADPNVITFLDWLYSPRVIGAILLVIISAAVSWI